MSIICKNGPVHKHETVQESKQCWGIIPGAPATPSGSAVAGPVRPYEHPDRATPSQLWYVGILHGDSIRAAGMTKAQCSDYIKQLKRDKEKAAPVPTPEPAKPAEPTEPAALPAPRNHTPRTKMIAEMLKLVRPGRYAVRPDALTPYVFLRISDPKHGKYKDSLKVQTQHGPNLSEAKFVIWPSGSISVYRTDVEPSLLLLIADQQGSARAYAKELGRCARCGLELTDEQSRAWGVGPECIKHWPWMRTLAEEETE
jgi:hypothetical protein